MTIKRQNKITGTLVFSALICLILVSCSENSISPENKSSPDNEESLEYSPSLSSVIPKPVYVEEDSGRFIFTDNTDIYINSQSSEIIDIGKYLADKLEPSTGFTIDVIPSTKTHSRNYFCFTLTDENKRLGKEGYRLEITEHKLTLSASKPAGLFRGVQTIRQLFDPRIESQRTQNVTWEIATGIIEDYPEFQWRGSMLDVARHFFSVEDVKRYIDLMAAFKMNRFHIHLTDDQGWRIMINSWPNLAIHGGSSEVGGGPGGYYTQEEFQEIISYAQERYIMVIPEIDMPGHSIAALSSYPELNCGGNAPPLYTGIEVPHSSLCLDKEITIEFVSDVIREISALSPSPYLHIGGDEVKTGTSEDYTNFIEEVEQIVQSNGKIMIGWEEVGRAQIDSTSIVQHWYNSWTAVYGVQKGTKVIMSPSSRMYMDMKYDYSTLLGQTWAGYINVKTAYLWYPSNHVEGITRDNIIGIEAPLWTETVKTIDEIEFMAYPRLIGYAEIGWSDPAQHDWNEYQFRLGLYRSRLEHMEIDFYKSPLILWQ